MTEEAPKKKRTNGRGMKARGDAYERELAAYLSDKLGINASRAPLSGGGFVGLNSGGADLLGVPDLFVEAKRVEALNFREALRQAETSISKTRAPELPIVVNRRNRESEGAAVVAMRLDDFIAIYRSHLLFHGHIKQEHREVTSPFSPFDF